MNTRRYSQLPCMKRCTTSHIGCLAGFTSLFSSMTFTVWLRNGRNLANNCRKAQPWLQWFVISWRLSHWSWKLSIQDLWLFTLSILMRKASLLKHGGRASLKLSPRFSLFRWYIVSFRDQTLVAGLRINDSSDFMQLANSNNCAHGMQIANA